MKKIWLALLLAFIPLKAHALITDPEVLQEKTVVVHFSTTVPAGATSNFALVSLSTTTGLFPHLERGEIDVSHINVSVDKLAASTGSVKVGVCTFVNASTGTVVFFNTSSFQKNVSNTNLPLVGNFSPAFYKCRVNSGRTAANADLDGTTPFILSNDKNTGSTAYQTDVTLPGPIGNVFPAPGDIIMEVKNFDITNTVIIFIDLWYHSER